ncbi:hypothetical protein D3C85_1771770 [compost metagenome]
MGLDGRQADFQFQGQLLVAGALAQQQRDLPLLGRQANQRILARLHVRHGQLQQGLQGIELG